MGAKKLSFLPVKSIKSGQFFLWLPLFGILICLGQFLFGITPPNINYYMGRFVKNIILLDAIHLAFTFGIIFGTTPGRDLILKRKRVFSTLKGVFVTVAVVTLLFVGNFIYRTKMDVAVIGGGVVFTFFWIWALFPTYHVMKQSYGIGLLMNRKVENGLSDVGDFKKSESFERHILNFNFICILLGLVLAEFSSSYSDVMQKVLALAAFSSILILLYSIFKNPVFDGSNKLLFSSRFLLWPLVFVSPLAGYFVVFIHGQEYLAIFLKIIKAESNVKAKKLAIMVSVCLLLVIIPLCILALIMGLGGSTPWESSFSVAVVFSFLPLISLLHYVSDSLIYRMRDRDVSLTIGKVLIL
jgi:hypothetical protein